MKEWDIQKRIEDALASVNSDYSKSFRQLFAEGEESKSQKRQLVKQFQRTLSTFLEGDVEVPIFKDKGDDWEKVQDRADIFWEKDNVLVEIDATRADQVAKKMLSRFCYASLGEKPVTYVAVLYPGTDSMNTEECKKYFKMGSQVLKSMNPENRFIGYIIGKTKDQDITFMAGQRMPVDFDKASYMDAYVKYLQDNGIESALSIENYKLPVNRISVYLDHHPDVSLESIEEEILRTGGFEGIIGKDCAQKKNTTSYWNKYKRYLKEKNDRCDLK